MPLAMTLVTEFLNWPSMVRPLRLATASMVAEIVSSGLEIQSAALATRVSGKFFVSKVDN